MSSKFSLANYRNSVEISIILETILCCIYTLLCGYTVGGLLLRKSRYSYIFFLIVLWLFTIFTLLLDWRVYQLKYWPDTGISEYWPRSFYVSIEMVYSSVWTEVDMIFSMLVMMIADALLMYRCYNICGRKKWILAASGTLLFAEIVGACAEFFRFANNRKIGRPTYRPFNLGYFILGFLTISIITTGVSTSLIILRILSATQGNPAIGNRAPYRKVMRIIIESGAIYLLGPVITVIPLALTCNNGPPFNNYKLYYESIMVLVYSQAFLTPLAGISPTLIALRVVTESSGREADESPPTSRLTFRRTTRRTHTPAFGSLVSSLHFESAWEAEDLVNETSCVADGETVDVEGSDGGEKIRQQEA